MQKITLKLTLIAFLIALAGCGMINTKPVDKREWISLSCSGFADWSVCNDKAERYCPQGFDVRNKDENLVTQGRTEKIACKK